jgi:hypothetical protein
MTHGMKRLMLNQAMLCTYHQKNEFVFGSLQLIENKALELGTTQRFFISPSGPFKFSLSDHDLY